jgi:hypothetical protein
MSESFVYLWYDALNKMYYLGKHLGVPTDNYAHSSVRMESFTMISKPAHMHRKILAYGTHDEMVELEHDLLVSRKHMFGTRYYNGSASFPTAFPGKDHHNYKHGKYMISLSEEEKKKNQSECFKAWYEENKEEKLRKTKEWQANNPDYMSAYAKKYNADPENKKKISANRKVRDQRPEVKSKRKERYKNDPEYRQKRIDAVRKWQKKNPNYQKEHQAKKRTEGSTTTQGEGTLKAFLK